MHSYSCLSSRFHTTLKNQRTFTNWLKLVIIPIVRRALLQFNYYVLEISASIIGILILGDQLRRQMSLKIEDAARNSFLESSGIVSLILLMSTWALIGTLGLAQENIEGEIRLVTTYILFFVVSIASDFIVLSSFKSFRNGDIILSLIASTNQGWNFFIFSVCLFALNIGLVLLIYEQYFASSIILLVLSLATNLLLGYVLFDIYNSIAFRFLSIGSVIILLLNVVVQFNIFHANLDIVILGRNTVALASTARIGSIFCLVLCSFVSPRHEMTKSEDREATLEFLGPISKGKWGIRYSLSPFIDHAEATLPTVLHENLLIFAVKKKRYGDTLNSWLQTADFRSGYNGIKRIWEALGVDRSAFFNYYSQTSQYQLRFSGENITFHNLEELNQYPELQQILKEFE